MLLYTRLVIVHIPTNTTDQHNHHINNNNHHHNEQMPSSYSKSLPGISSFFIHMYILYYALSDNSQSSINSFSEQKNRGKEKKTGIFCTHTHYTVFNHYHLLRYVFLDILYMEKVAEGFLLLSTRFDGWIKILVWWCWLLLYTLCFVDFKLNTLIEEKKQRSRSTYKWAHKNIIIVIAYTFLLLEVKTIIAWLYRPIHEY